jgi:hypothetical protein
MKLSAGFVLSALVFGIVALLMASPQNFSDLPTLFRSPPAEFRPIQIIHGFDNLGSDTQTIRKRLQELRALGIGGLVVNVSFRDYLRSEEQWRLFLDGLKVAEELGFVLWLYDEEGYPSGAAGGLVLERNPNYEAIGLVRVIGDDGKVRLRG